MINTNQCPKAKGDASKPKDIQFIMRKIILCLAFFFSKNDNYQLSIIHNEIFSQFSDQLIDVLALHWTTWGESVAPLHICRGFRRRGPPREKNVPRHKVLHISGRAAPRGRAVNFDGAPRRKSCTAGWSCSADSLMYNVTAQPKGKTNMTMN